MYTEFSAKKEKSVQQNRRVFMTGEKEKTMAKEKKLVEAITSMEEDLARCGEEGGTDRLFCSKGLHDH